MAATKPSDPLLHCFQSLSQCTPDIEKQALDRLASGAKPGSRAEIQFAMGVVNQANHLFAKKSAEIRKESEGKRSRETPLLASIERMVRVVVCAFKFLYQNRRAAGFSALALEKTLSNFITACANAHLGLNYSWDALVILREWLLDYADSHTMAPAPRLGNKDKPAARAVRKPVAATRARPGPAQQAASRS
ncbi:hypothetical protein LPJ75_001060, partial [Coemansia sp. RSA 2598]